MTSMRDVSDWLSSPAGHVFQAEHGGYDRARAALIEADQASRHAAHQLNQQRLADGLVPLGIDAAMAAVRPRGGPCVAGPTDVVKGQFRDPSWRIKTGVDETEHTPVMWDSRSQGWIDFVNAGRR